MELKTPSLHHFSFAGKVIKADTALYMIWLFVSAACGHRTAGRWASTALLQEASSRDWAWSSSLPCSHGASQQVSALFSTSIATAQHLQEVSQEGTQLGHKSALEFSSFPLCRQELMWLWCTWARYRAASVWGKTEGETMQYPDSTSIPWWGLVSLDWSLLGSPVQRTISTNLSLLLLIIPCSSQSPMRDLHPAQGPLLVTCGRCKVVFRLEGHTRNSVFGWFCYLKGTDCRGTAGPSRRDVW